MSKATDRQTGGSHYSGLAIQPVEYIEANNLSYSAGNVVKYVTRYKAKNGAEDIRKAIHYCELILDNEYKESYNEPQRTGPNSPDEFTTVYSLDLDRERQVRDNRYSVYGSSSED